MAYYYFYRQFFRKKGQRILLYHSVGSVIPHDTYGISISPELFRSQLDFVTGNCEVVPLGRTVRDNDVVITFDDGYVDNLYVAAEELRKRNMPFTVFVTASYIQNGSKIYLSSEDLKELASLEGVTIGSHGMSHTPLAECDDATLRKELYESRSYLEDVIGKPVTFISYPHGSVDRRVREAVRKVGYEIGASSYFGCNGTDHDPLMLYRTEVLASDVLSLFHLKLAGAYDWYQWRQKLVSENP